MRFIVENEHHTIEGDLAILINSLKLPVKITKFRVLDKFRIVGNSSEILRSLENRNSLALIHLKESIGILIDPHLS